MRSVTVLSRSGGRDGPETRVSAAGSAAARSDDCAAAVGRQPGLALLVVYGAEQLAAGVGQPVPGVEIAQHIGQRGRAEIRHADRLQTARAVARVNRHDMGVLQPGQRLGFASLIRRDLQGHQPVRQVRLPRQIHPAEGAAAQLLFETEAQKRIAHLWKPGKPVGDSFGGLGAGAVQVAKQAGVRGIAVVGGAPAVQVRAIVRPQIAKRVCRPFQRRLDRPMPPGRFRLDDALFCHGDISAPGRDVPPGCAGASIRQCRIPNLPVPGMREDGGMCDGPGCEKGSSRAGREGPHAAAKPRRNLPRQAVEGVASRAQPL